MLEGNEYNLITFKSDMVDDTRRIIQETFEWVELTVNRAGPMLAKGVVPSFH